MKYEGNFNSNENQQIKDKFVNREVYLNVTELMSHLQQSEDKGDYFDEIMNVSSQPNYIDAAEYAGWNLDEDSNLWIHTKNQEELNQYEEAQDVCEEENLDYSYEEALCYFSVSDWFGNLLSEQGEMVEEIFGLKIWGRQTFGQSISMDGVISNICADLEILDGQDSAWNKK